jgi:hypothetical protein
MKLHANLVGGLLLLAAGAAAAQTQAPQWQTVGAAQYVCGGVSSEGMEAIKALRSGASGELLFTNGPEGGYLADVAVTVHGGSLKEAMSFTADGPVCLLKLPPGSYTVDAVSRGKPLKQALKIGGALQQLKFNWPAF